LLQNGPHLVAWQKLYLGWLDAAQVPCIGLGDLGGTFTLAPLETAGGVKAVAIRTGPSTAIVAENRQQLPGRDAGLCDHGLLVYSVDASTPSGAGPIRVVQATPGQDSDPAQIAACGLRYNATFDARAGKADTFTDAAHGLTIHITSSVAGGAITVDVTHVVAQSSYVAVQPERLLETRASVGQIGYTGAKPAAGTTVPLQVVGAGNTKVPAGASSVVLNVTAVDATTNGYVTV
jgi:hypothetical protein